MMFGFDGLQPPANALELIRGGAAGAILMKRNVARPADVFALNQELRAVADRPFLVGLDQEGGRVARLRDGFTRLPALREIGRTRDPESALQMGRILGRECRAVGFDLDFAPVVDVDSNPRNPVIGDRSFGNDPAECGRLGAAMIAGIQESIAACAKHFPGHGDTHQDSHLDLPRLSHDLARLRAIELPPFHAAVEAGVATLMTAHVVIETLDPELPATLSTRVLPRLRAEIGFEGVMVSDDLEMAAIADRFAMEEAAARAVEAGCDLLLVCHRCDRQQAAIAGISRWAERNVGNRDRLREASGRVARLAATYARSLAPIFEPGALRTAEALAFAERFAGETRSDPTERPA
jgi:beta-N-acetylhexosaminidase